MERLTSRYLRRSPLHGSKCRRSHGGISMLGRRLTDLSHERKLLRPLAPLDQQMGIQWQPTFSARTCQVWPILLEGVLVAVRLQQLRFLLTVRGKFTKMASRRRLGAIIVRLLRQRAWRCRPLWPKAAIAAPPTRVRKCWVLKTPRNWLTSSQLDGNGSRGLLPTQLLLRRERQ